MKWVKRVFIWFYHNGCAIVLSSPQDDNCGKFLKQMRNPGLKTCVQRTTACLVVNTGCLLICLTTQQQYLKYSTGNTLMSLPLFWLRNLPCLFSQMCSACRNSGATLGCFFKSCPNKYHYKCALESGECGPPGIRLHLPQVSLCTFMSMGTMCAAICQLTQESKVRQWSPDVSDHCGSFTEKKYYNRLLNTWGKKIEGKQWLHTTQLAFKSPEVLSSQIGLKRQEMLAVLSCLLHCGSPAASAVYKKPEMLGGQDASLDLPTRWMYVLDSERIRMFG